MSCRHGRQRLSGEPYTTFSLMRCATPNCDFGAVADRREGYTDRPVYLFRWRAPSGQYFWIPEGTDPKVYGASR